MYFIKYSSAILTNILPFRKAENEKLQADRKAMELSMEVYGTKPKKFTKAWWGYFWFYYKWHTLGTILAAFIITYTCVDCSNRASYDVIADYISETVITEQQTQALGELINTQISDADGNGKIETYILNLASAGEMDAQVIQAKQTRITLEPQYSESFIFLLSKKYADNFAQFDTSWEESSVWTDAAPEEDGFMVNLSGCTALEDLGIDTKDLYLTVRKLREDETEDEYKINQHENALKFAKYLINQR